MPQDWDFYMSAVDGRPGFVRLDLALTARAPDPHFPLMGYLRIHLNEQRENGFPTENEFVHLSLIEKTVAALLPEHPGMIDTGVVTTDGFRDLIFYGPSEAVAARLFEQIVKRHPSHRFETGTMHDPDWTYYRDFLYPDARTRQTMNNRKVYATLAEKGDGGRAMREIAHWAYFPNEAARDLFVAAIEKQNFVVRNLSTAEGGNPHGVEFWRNDAPHADGFDAITLTLFDAARAADGEYDGWETRIVTLN